MAQTVSSREVLCFMVQCRTVASLLLDHSAICRETTLSRKRLYLVDGMSQLYRAYYAIKSLSNSKGLPTNAVFGFTAMLRKLIQDEKPDYIAVAFDLEGPTVRHDKFEAYKATRKP